MKYKEKIEKPRQPLINRNGVSKNNFNFNAKQAMLNALFSSDSIGVRIIILL